MMYEMSNAYLETATIACNHWLAVKRAVILCLDMSRKTTTTKKNQHTIPSISRSFYSPSSHPSLLLHYSYAFPHVPGLEISLAPHL